MARGSHPALKAVLYSPLRPLPKVRQQRILFIGLHDASCDICVGIKVALAQKKIGHY